MTQAYNLSQFANFVDSSGQVSASGIQSGAIPASFPTGTVLLFYQASAPTGWTQVTSLNDYDLRLVSGTGGTTGGTTAYSTVFTNQTPTISGSFTAGATTLSTSQMPSHNHPITSYAFVCGCTGQSGPNAQYGIRNLSGNAGSTSTQVVNSEGGGGSHTHSISGSPSSSAITLNVRYANTIICSKN